MSAIAPTVAVAKSGVNAAVIGVEKPAGTPAGWNNVIKLVCEVATDSGFTNIVFTGKTEGTILNSAQFSFLAPNAGHFFARGRATNNYGESANSSTVAFDTDTSEGDTDTPEPPTIMLYNTSDQATVNYRQLKIRVNFASSSNNKGVWCVGAQAHTSATMTDPESSPVYNPGTSKGTIVKGGIVFTDASETFITGGVQPGHVIMCSYNDPWPGSPATRVFLAGVRSVDSETQITINGVWSQPSGDYTYRIVKRQDDPTVDSGPGFVVSTLVYDQETRDRGYAEILISLPIGTNYYVRAWVFNLWGRSSASAVSSAKQATAIEPEGLSGYARSQHGVFLEAFESLPSTWREAASGSGTESIVSGEGQVGGKIYRSTGYRWRVYPSNIPYDKSKLYRIRARVRRTSGGTAGTIYVGVCGYAADGVTRVNVNGLDQDSEQHYICASNVQPASGVWTEYTGWFKGWAATGSSSPSTDPTNPAHLHENVRYFRPLFIVDYSAGTENQDVDEIVVDVFDESAADNAYKVTNYAQNTAPNGTFSNFQSPSISSRADASCDIVLQFTYNQGSVPAAGFLVFFNLTGATVTTSDAAWAIDARSGNQTYTIKVTGLNPSTYYSFGVAAYAPARDGRVMTSLQAPGSWQNFQPATAPNFTGNIDGTAATTVRTNAVNGATAFTDTTQYRSNTPPSNAPSFTGLNYTLFEGHVSVVQFSFTYTQGSNKATHFAFYLKQGGGTIVQSDPHFLVSAGAGTTVKMPFAIAHYGLWSFGIAAVAVCKDGPQYNPTITTYLNNDLSGTRSLGLDGETTWLHGEMYVHDFLRVGSAGILDLNTYGGALKLRKVSNLTGVQDEFHWANDGTYRGFMFQDGVNRFLHARKAGDSKGTSSVDPGDTDSYDHGTIQTSSEDGLVGYHTHDVPVGSHAHSMPSHYHSIDLDDIVREWANP